MANVREYIQINPTEKRNRALGIVFPFNAEGVFYSSYTTKEQVKSNLLNVLLTEPGERVFKPNFGVGLRNYLFENSNDISLLEEKINNQINQNITGIELSNINVIKSPDSHEINIIISYRVLANQELDTIQINFAQDNSINNSGVSSPNVGAPSSGASSGGGY
tara:strand:+ start:295 stop:783 length:489 start_codon:yes stop_codon:yes gene_type:complete